MMEMERRAVKNYETPKAVMDGNARSLSLYGWSMLHLLKCSAVDDGVADSAQSHWSAPT